MNQSMLSIARTALILFGVLCAGPALAQTGESAEQEALISVDVSIEAVSEYRFRGVSLSEFDPALQPSLTVTHALGFYANAWGSNIADYGGADFEADFTLGWSGDIGEGTSIDAYAMYYTYPGASRLNYAEFGAILVQAIGDGSIAAEVNYSPPQQGTGDVDNIYLGVRGTCR